MRKIRIISALLACAAFGATQAYALDIDHIAMGKPMACPLSQDVAQEVQQKPYSVK